MLKRLPIGESNFENLIREGFLYVDKTQYIYNLITSSKYHFLARPRRFGKSLLISTLEQVFKGKRELFKGLWIYESDYDWKEYSIIRLDMNSIDAETPENLKQSLKGFIQKTAKANGLKLQGSFLKQLFEELVEELYAKSGKYVVVLIDEYDKPIISHLGRGKEHLEVAKENRQILKDFYGTLKAASVIERLRFVLLTGVSKFSKAGVFSELNNLFDLTMDSHYASMLGITEEEVDRYFKEYMQEYAQSKGISYEEAREEVRRYYNGYRFSEAEVKVYNPFSFINLLVHKKLKNYWFETGTPTFLINLIKERNYNIVEAEDYTVRSSAFSAYELESLSVPTLLFQTGYLTIRDYSEEEDTYTLSYPNLEVKTSFIDFLYNDLTGRQTYSLYPKLYKTLSKGDIEGFISVIQTIFATITYDEGAKLNEANFHTLFYLMLSAGGLPAQSQVLNYMGRIDMVVELKDKVYVFEFKCNQSAEEAINQIIAKDYHRQYVNTGKGVYLVGIDFSIQSRNIAAFKWMSAN